MSDLQFRVASQTPQDYLASVVANAQEIAAGISPELEQTWRSRAAELRSGFVTNPETLKWLCAQVDYWGEKDRDYADYLKRLMGSSGVVSKG